MVRKTKGNPFVMFSLSTYKTPLIAGFFVLSFALIAMALSVEQPLAEKEFKLSELAQSQTYANYRSDMSTRNLSRGQCAFTSMNSEVCALDGYAAPLTYLGLALTCLGAAGFARRRASDNSDGTYA